MESMNNNGDSSGNDDEEAENPYLAMRRAKIARNAARLRELGLAKPPPPPTGAGGAKRARRKPSSAVVRNEGPARRSARLSGRVVDYKDVSLSSIADRNPAAVSFHYKSKDLVAARCSARQVAAKPAAAPASNSVRLIDLDVRALIAPPGRAGRGSDCSSGSGGGLLGKMVECTGKEHVIDRCFSLSASPQDVQRLAGTKLSFNKYCGIQEWKNCAFLWVNLGTPDTPNEWLDGGRRITWFGGSRMHDESPVIHKLIRYGKDASTKAAAAEAADAETAEAADAEASEADNEQSDDSNSNAIILWCRRYDALTKRFSPYVCFGRVGYRSHVPNSRPLSFVWDLIDYEKLVGHDVDKEARETFELFTRCSSR